jgi:hypothetical protein
MPPNLLLMCKLLAVAVLATGHVRILPDPFLPFIDGLDRLLDPQVFRTTLQTVAVVSAVSLLFNRWVRGSALILGGCILLAVVCSRAYYGNNKTFVGLALVLAALSDFDRLAYLLRWQLALVYFGAALNKLLDPDWQSGLFFEHWAGVRLQNPLYLAVSERLPPLLAGKMMCWGTTLTEFVVAFGLLVPRLVPYALWINALFQIGLLEFTGDTFTLFFYAMQAATLAFVAWPERLFVLYNRERWRGRWLHRMLKLADPDGLQEWHPTPSDSVWTLECRSAVGGSLRGPLYRGFAVVSRLLLYCPAFWLAATVLLALPAAVQALAPELWAWVTVTATMWRRGLVAGIFLLILPAFWREGRWAYRWSDTAASSNLDVPETFAGPVRRPS